MTGLTWRRLLFLLPCPSSKRQCVQDLHTNLRFCHWAYLRFKVHGVYFANRSLSREVGEAGEKTMVPNLCKKGSWKSRVRACLQHRQPLEVSRRKFYQVLLWHLLVPRAQQWWNLIPVQVPDEKEEVELEIGPIPSAMHSFAMRCFVQNILEWGGSAVANSENEEGRTGVSGYQVRDILELHTSASLAKWWVWSHSSFQYISMKPSDQWPLSSNAQVVSQLQQ